MHGMRIVIIFLSVILTCGMSVVNTCHTASADDEKVDFLSDAFYDDDPEEEVYSDPFEEVNRIIFTFNDTVFVWILEPVATGYNYVVPYDFRLSINNFFRNLEEPVRFINALLQGRVEDSFTLLGRFLINSTLGVYGLGDAAAREFNLPPVEATLGETLATWGVGDGFYIVVPLYGSSTLRDFTGTVVDGFALTPYYTWTDDLYVMSGIYLGKETNKLSFHIGEYDELKKVFFDPYIAFRNAYFQYRRKIGDHTPRMILLTDRSGCHNSLNSLDIHSALQGTGMFTVQDPVQ